MKKILRPDDKSLDDLCQRLTELAGDLKDATAFPAAQLKRCAEQGVFAWFSDPQWGGQGWSEADIYRGYFKLSAACLTTAFVMTQRQGATRRIENSGNQLVGEKLVPALLNGDIFATVGISHLTTSRRHLSKPVLRAAENEAGFRIDGFSPWVTGANSADWIVIGATLENGQEILAALDTRLDGVTVKPGPELVALSASQTGSVHCDSVQVDRDYLLAGPVENVMQSGVGGNTGGLQTSALALGLSTAAIDFIKDESVKRDELKPTAETFDEQCQSAKEQLLNLAEGHGSWSRDHLRSEANSLVLRSTQAALSAAKGAGFLADHRVGRWCREALFFLVWSCPQAVVDANLCQFAGIESSYE